ncbi:MAG: hypothetical protein KDC24_00580, partial [Saprospiraceae bacterium]|nr:hypothetical protein [Saprospiraceae bacterium]
MKGDRVFLRLLWIYFLAILSGSNLLAQESAEDFNLKVYGFEDGLSHRNVFSIQQDSIGYLWIGTINGLNRYDGTGFLHKNNDRWLHDKVVSDLLPAENEDLWVGYSGGVCCIQHHPDSVIRYFPDTSSSLFSKVWRPKNLFRIQKNTLVCLGQDNDNGTLVLMRSNEEGRFDDMLSFPNKSNFTPSIFWDNKIVIEALPGTIWFIQGITIKKLKLPDQDGFVTDLSIDKNENLNILLSSGTIYKIEKGNNTISESIEPPGAGPFQCFLKEDNGNYWLGGYGQLLFYNIENGTTIDLHEPLRQLVRNTSQVRQIFKDRLGVIWVATDFGLVKITIPENRFKSFLSGGNEYCSNGFCSMRGLAEAENGNIYASYYNGIHVFNPGDRRLRPLFPNRNINIPPYGLWAENDALFTGNGLRINLLTKRIDTLLLPLRGGEGVFGKNGGELLLGLEDTLYSLSPVNNRWNPIFNLNDALQENVKDLITAVETQGENILIGTYK